MSNVLERISVMQHLYVDGMHVQVVTNIYRSWLPEQKYAWLCLIQTPLISLCALKYSKTMLDCCIVGDCFCQRPDASGFRRLKRLCDWMYLTAQTIISCLGNHSIMWLCKRGRKERVSYLQSLLVSYSFASFMPSATMASLRTGLWLKPREAKSMTQEERGSKPASWTFRIIQCS